MLMETKIKQISLLIQMKSFHLSHFVEYFDGFVSEIDRNVRSSSTEQLSCFNRNIILVFIIACFSHWISFCRKTITKHNEEIKMLKISEMETKLQKTLRKQIVNFLPRLFIYFLNSQWIFTRKIYENSISDLK